jgi:predicted Zn-dependent peptidase
MSLQTFKLQNGMTIAFVPRPTNQVVYVSLVIKNGKIFENVEQLSYTHMFEHLLARFTSKKYPNFHKLKKKLSFYGIQHNAFTDSFTTGYWFMGMAKYIDFILDVLSHSFFSYQKPSHNEWLKLKNIVLEEIK